MAARPVHETPDSSGAVQDTRGGLSIRPAPTLSLGRQASPKPPKELPPHRALAWLSDRAKWHTACRPSRRREANIPGGGQDAGHSQLRVGAVSVASPGEGDHHA